MRRLTRPLWALLALLLLAEEWLWDRLQSGMRALALRLHLHRLETLLRALPPWASLLVLLAPAALLLPFKLAALWALGHGHWVLGSLVFVAAKLCGTALAAYLFDLVRASARRLAWFDRLYTAIMGLLARTRAWLQVQPGYQRARAQLRFWRERLRRPSQGAGWRRRLRALRRRLGLRTKP